MAKTDTSKEKNHREPWHIAGFPISAQPWFPWVVVSAVVIAQSYFVFFHG